MLEVTVKLHVQSSPNFLCMFLRPWLGPPIIIIVVVIILSPPVQSRRQEN